jgi:hypothetical protein
MSIIAGPTRSDAAWASCEHALLSWLPDQPPLQRIFIGPTAASRMAFSMPMLCEKELCSLGESAVVPEPDGCSGPPNRLWRSAADTKLRH